MDGEWVFATGTRLDDCFQQQLLLRASSALVKRVVMEKLEDVRRNPVSPNPFMLEHEPVHFVKTGRFVAGEATVPPLLIVYSLDHVNRLIFLIHICDAMDVDTSADAAGSRWAAERGLHGSLDHGDRPPAEPLPRTLDRVIDQASRQRGH
jgi:hypothetical protein